MHPISRSLTVSALALGAVGLTGVRLVAAESDTNAERRLQYRSGSAEHARAWQKRVRAELFDILKLDDLVGKTIPLNPKIIKSEDCGTYTLREIELSSTPTRRYKVVFTFPRRSTRPVPGVVCIHGHGGNRTTPYDPKKAPYKEFGKALAERGAVTISTDVGQHKVYERDKGRILMGERLWDLMRCVDYLVAIDKVDKGRIGCAGLSLGGEMAMWLGAMDTRIAATVSCGFLTVMDQMEKNHCMCWKFPGLRERVDYADIYALIAPRPLQCQNGLKEGTTQFYVPIARKAMSEIKPIYADLGKPENVELHVHPGGHEIDLPALLLFLGKHLRMPPSH